MSVMEPPEFVTVGEPKKPEKKRKSRRAAILGARALASWKTTKSSNTTRYIVFRPLLGTVSKNRLAIFTWLVQTRFQKEAQKVMDPKRIRAKMWRCLMSRQSASRQIGLLLLELLRYRYLNRRRWSLSSRLR